MFSFAVKCPFCSPHLFLSLSLSLFFEKISITKLKILVMNTDFFYIGLFDTLSYYWRLLELLSGGVWGFFEIYWDHLKYAMTVEDSQRCYWISLAIYLLKSLELFGTVDIQLCSFFFFQSVFSDFFTGFIKLFFCRIPAILKCHSYTTKKRSDRVKRELSDNGSLIFWHDLFLILRT